MYNQEKNRETKFWSNYKNKWMLIKFEIIQKL